MATVKISALPPAAALVGTEVMPVVQAGATVKATVQNVANLSGTNIVTTAINYTVLPADATIIATAGVTLTLPIGGIGIGKTFRLKASTNALVTVSCAANIDIATSFLITGYQSIDVQWDGGQYWIL